MAVDIELSVRTDALRRDLQQAGRLTDRQIRQTVTRYERGWKQTEKAARRAAIESQRAWDRAMDHVGGRFASLGREIEGFVGAGRLGMVAAGATAAAGTLVALGVGAYQAVDGMSRYVDEISLMSESTGLASETVLALRHALASGGTSIDRVQGGLAEFTKRLGDAAAKGGESAAVFKRYGIAITSADGSLRSADDVMRDALVRIDAIGSETERASARLVIFGAEAGRAMAALSPESLAASERETAGLAEAVDRAAGASAAWDRTMADVDVSLSKVTVHLGDSLQPALSGLVSLIGDPDKPGTLLGGMAEWAALHPVIAVAFGSDETRQGWIDWITGTNAALATSVARTRELRAQYEALRQAQTVMEPVSAQPSLSEWSIATGDVPEAGAGVTLTGAGPVIPAAPAPTSRTGASPRPRSSRPPVSPFGGAIDLSSEYGEEEADRQRTRAQGAQMLAQMQIDAIAEVAAAQEAQRLREEEEIERLGRLRTAREALATTVVSSISRIVQASGAGAQATASAALIETVAYQAVAVARAFAEGGPFAGPIAAAAAIGTIGAQIAQLAAASGQGAPGGGGGRAGGRGRQTSLGQRSRGEVAPVSLTMQYEHRGFSAFFDDHERSRGRRRGPRAQRAYAGR